MSKAEESWQLQTAPGAFDVCHVIRHVLYSSAATAAAMSNSECLASRCSEQESVHPAAQVLQVAAALEHLPVGLQKGELDAVISALAPALLEDSRAPLRLVAVLDKSRSMKGDKIRLVQKTMLFMLEHLSENDALGIVAYDQTASVLAPLTFCDEAGCSRLEAALMRLQHGKGTNISDGLFLGLGLHAEAATRVESGPAPSKVRFGNTYRRLSFDEAPPQDGKDRVHEWTVELHLENDADAALISKVVYNLHNTFKESEVEVADAPFRLRRVGWGTFCVRATIHLHHGGPLKLEHELCFDSPETFKTQLVQLRQAARKVKVSAALTGKEWGVIDAGGKQFVRELHPDISKLLGIDIAKMLLLNCNGAILNDHIQVTTMNDVVFIETSALDQHKTMLKLEYQGEQATKPAAIAEDSVVRSTFMFTDGLATAGLKKAEEICAKTEEKLRQLGTRFCSLTTFGFGASHNEELLQNLAAKGRGNYSFIEGEDMIGEAFCEAIGGLLTTSHQNVRLCLELAPGVRLERAHTTFPLETCDAGVEIAIGDLFADEQRNVLVTFKLPDDFVETSEKEDVVWLGRLGARGMRTLNPAGSEEAERVELRVFRSQDDKIFGLRAGNEQVARHRNRLMSITAFAEARVACAKRNFHSARQILQAAIDKLASSALTQQGDALSVGLLTDLMECLEDLIVDCKKLTKDNSKKDIRDDLKFSKSSKKMAACCETYRWERKTGGATSSSVRYENATQRRVKLDFKEKVHSESESPRLK